MRSEPAAAPRGVSPALVLRVWFSIGLQSFGGGATTFALIRRAAVERHGWLSEGEFSRLWALCQVTPGINLLALSILVGRRVSGARGVAFALLGLLLPSVTMTLLLTAFFAQIRDLETVQAALRGGVVPATVGLGLLTTIQIARPLLADSRREGAGSLAAALSFLVVGGTAVGALRLPVLSVLCACGAAGALLGWQRRHRRATAPPRTDPAAGPEPR
jgi:chromate transporter